jgi:hypothetical protein
MPRYLISFDDGSMDHIPEEDWPAVGCQRSAYWSHSVIGIMEPVRDRHIGATW